MALSVSSRFRSPSPYLSVGVGSWFPDLEIGAAGWAFAFSVIAVDCLGRFSAEWSV